MIVKMVQKESEAGSYFHELLVEGNRIEIQFHSKYEADGGFDWSYTDQRTTNPQSAAYVVKVWNRWPSDSYEIGVVRSGKIFLVNAEGKTIDKYSI